MSYYKIGFDDLLPNDPRIMEKFDAAMSEKGWVIFESLMPRELIDWMLVELDEAYELCRQIQIRNGIADATEYTVHHLIGQGRSWLACLSRMPNDFIAQYFDGPFILNSFGGALNQAHSKSYAHAIHRDQRSYSTDRLMLNTLVMLDDFTADNGATWLLSGGHLVTEEPHEERFAAVAEQAIAPAGSVLMFDSRLWHSGGDNHTDKPRRSVTPLYSKPWYRPEFDYPRVLGEYPFVSDEIRQILGYNSRVPCTLHDFYQPPEKRFYKAGQG